jgi:hypothetical protein
MKLQQFEGLFYFISHQHHQYFDPYNLIPALNLSLQLYLIPHTPDFKKNNKTTIIFAKTLVLKYGQV